MFAEQLLLSHQYTMDAKATVHGYRNFYCQEFLATQQH